MSVERGTCQHEKEKEEPMAIISPEDRQTLQTLFAQELQDDVNITYFTQRESVLIVPGQESSSCKETRELLEELTETALPHGKSCVIRFKPLFSSDSAWVSPPRPQRRSSALEQERTMASVKENEEDVS